MNLIYYADQIKITFGVPVSVPGILEADFSINDFISLEILQNQDNFDVETGVFRETIIVYNPRNTPQINLTLAYGAPENELMDAIYRAQQFGVIGLPLTIRSSVNQLTNPNEKRRRTYTCPVSVLKKRPDESLGIRGAPLVYQIKTPLLESFYI
jgi:hypothetical protein